MDLIRKLQKFDDTLQDVIKGRTWLELFPRYFVPPLEQVKGMSEWSRIKFGCAEELNKVPNDRKGIYAFIISNEGKQYPPNSYIMYIGVSSKGRSSLRQRYQTYLQYSQMENRALTYPFIMNFSDCLYFYFSSADKGIGDKTLRRLEMEINSKFSPPYSKSDIKPNLKKARRLYPF